MNMAKKLSRRDFLKLSATAVSTAAVGVYVPEALAAPVKVQAAKKLIFSSYTWSGYDVAINKVIDNWIATQPAGSVEVERQFGDQASYWDKLQTQLVAGTPPDLGIADYGRLISYAKNGTLLNITDRLKASDLP